jgi:hypothetical protein
LLRVEERLQMMGEYYGRAARAKGLVSCC